VKTKPRTVAVPVRLDSDLRHSLRTAARRTHTNVSALMRFAILKQLAEIERTGELRVSAVTNSPAA
jgi:predicted transcriptional regulator